ncbi:MAG TPA: L-histidine N(alpha)-methyltransferase [Thermodesulfobacteriota bacterium]|nr:L-histidine N(alpha)-methyltransferase [Thermodesulfobacteriota bacterium]
MRAPRTARRRLTLVERPSAGDSAAFARDVAAGLTRTPKRLPCRYFYDREGSLLFEEICRLPEYYLPRAEREILERRAPEIAALLPAGAALVELGSGSATKTRLLIEALLRRQGKLRYVPVDISRSVLEESARALLADHPRLAITAIAAEYEEGLEVLRRTPLGPKLLLWLGSNIGNLERPEAAAFLRRLRDLMAPADRLLVGVDLRKDRAVLERAYDDAQGVTARFNLNLLARINRELGGRFDLDAFRHRAVYDEAAGRVEMYLVSTRPQRVAIERLGLEVPFAAGEAIHTENSYKYAPDEIEALAAAAGLRLERLWLDDGQRFADVLLGPQPA